jgi:hypothetical protein
VQTVPLQVCALESLAASADDPLCLSPSHETTPMRHPVMAAMPTFRQAFMMISASKWCASERSHLMTWT